MKDIKNQTLAGTVSTNTHTRTHTQIYKPRWDYHLFMVRGADYQYLLMSSECILIHLIKARERLCEEIYNLPSV